MPFPAGLTVITVTGRIAIPPLPSPQAVPDAIFECLEWLQGPSDDAFLPPFKVDADVNVTTGEFTVDLPATNDPQWTAFEYKVTLRYGNKYQPGKLTVPFDGGSFDLSDRFVPDAVPAAIGPQYMLLSLRGAPGGVASLDATTLVPLAQMPILPISKVTGLQDALDSKLADPASISDVTGLQGALDGKSAVGHTHAIADVTSLQAALDGKQAAGSYVTLSAFNDDQDAQDAAVAAALAPLSIGLTGFFKATDHGFVGWSFDPRLQQGQFVLPTAGLSHVVRVRCLTNVITGIRFHFVSPGSGLNNCFATVHNGAGALIGADARTADQSGAGGGSSNWTVGGDKACPLITPQGATPGADYLVRFWFNGTTGPSLSRAGSSSGAAINWGLSAPNFMFSTADSGLTTAVLAPQNIGTQTAHGVALLVGLY